MTSSPNSCSTIRNYPSSFCITIQIYGNLNRKITLKALKPQQNIHDPSNWSLSRTSVYYRCVGSLILKGVFVLFADFCYPGSNVIFVILALVFTG